MLASRKFGLLAVMVAAVVVIGTCKEDSTGPGENGGGGGNATKWTADWQGVWDIKEDWGECGDTTVSSVGYRQPICKGGALADLFRPYPNDFRPASCTFTLTSSKFTASCSEWEPAPVGTEDVTTFTCTLNRSGNEMMGTYKRTHSITSEYYNDFSCMEASIVGTRVSDGAEECAVAAPQSGGSGE